MSFESVLSQRLAERKAQHRYRSHQTLQSPQGPTVRLRGRSLLNFCSNDYLGLASHPDIAEAMHNAVADWGVGSGASHLVCGHSEQHHLLEQELAAFTGRDRALLFSTGYMANLGVIAALLSRQDSVFEDRLNHASLLDGGLFSGARFQRFAHNNLDDLQRRLQKSATGEKLIVVDGVFSMDGDCAPLTELASLAEKERAWLMVDDAHGLGVLGRTGAGLCQQQNLSQQQVPILMGTLGKAFGSFGAFVAGSELLIESLIQFARTYIYTTAMPPAVAAATRASLRIVQQDVHRRERLQQRIQQFRRGILQLGLPDTGSQTAIQPILLGCEQRAMTWSQKLDEMAFWVAAIRPPTVPNNSARLRVCLTAEHSESHVDALLNAIQRCIEAEIS